MTQRIRKSKRSRKRGGAKTPEQNYRNCKYYWKQYDDATCRKMSNHGHDFPGLVNKYVFQKPPPPPTPEYKFPDNKATIVASVDGNKYVGTVQHLVLRDVYYVEKHQHIDSLNLVMGPNDRWSYLHDHPKDYQDNIAYKDADAKNVVAV